MTIPTLLADDVSMYSTHGIIVTCVIGLIIGVIAKLLMPGKDPGGCIITIIIGLVGSWIGTFLGRLLFHQAYAGWILSVVGAMLLLFVYRLAVGRKGP